MVIALQFLVHVVLHWIVDTLGYVVQSLLKGIVYVAKGVWHFIQRWIVDTLVHVAQFIWNVVLHRIIDAIIYIVQALWGWIVHVIIHGLQSLVQWLFVWRRFPHWDGNTGIAWAGHSIADGTTSVAHSLSSGAQALSHGAAQVGHIVAHGVSSAALHALGYGPVGIGHGMAMMPSFAVLSLPNEMPGYFYLLELIIIWIGIVRGISIILESTWCGIIAICVVLWPDIVAYITTYVAQALWDFVQRWIIGPIVDLMQALWSVVPDPIASAIVHAMQYLLDCTTDVVRYIDTIIIRDLAPLPLLSFVWHVIIHAIQTWHRVRDQIVSAVAHDIIHGLQGLRHWGGNNGTAWIGHSITDGAAYVAHGLISGAQALSHGAAQVGHGIAHGASSAGQALGDGGHGLGYGPVGIGHGMAMMPSFAAQTLAHQQGYLLEVIVLGVGIMMGVGIGIAIQMMLQKIGWKGMVIGAVTMIGTTIGVGALITFMLKCGTIAKVLIWLGKSLPSGWLVWIGRMLRLTCSS